jgi:hypothetical protein
MNLWLPNKLRVRKKEATQITSCAIRAEVVMKEMEAGPEQSQPEKEKKEALLAAKI